MPGYNPSSPFFIAHNEGSSSRGASPAPIDPALIVMGTPTDGTFDLPPRPPGSGLSSHGSSVSLSTHYIPTKFSSGALVASDSATSSGTSSPRRRHGHTRGRRRSKRVEDGPEVPKMGGGVDAFRSGEARIPGDGDEDSDSDLRNTQSSRWFGPCLGSNAKSNNGKQLRWNKFKWTLFIANTIFTLCALTGLIVTLLFWFDVFHHADIIRVGNRTELILSTFAATFALLTAMVGWAGILLNNRCFLAWYNLFLWMTFIFLVAPGYITYKKRAFNLEGKVNAQWSRDLGAEGRLRIQNQLNCCGYFSPFVEATISQTCYSRSILPGCKLGYMRFERHALQVWYQVVFGLVPFQIAVMVVALLCSNHVTYRFGKGMMPKAYRLSLGTMAVVMDNYASQLVEQYGSDVASEILARSRSTLNLEGMQLPYITNLVNSPPSSRPGSFAGPNPGPGAVFPGPGIQTKETPTKPGAKYVALGSRPPLDSDDSLR